MEIFREGKFVQRAKPLRISAHRSPRKIPQPCPAKKQGEPPSTDYLGHLVKKHLRDESVPEPAGENEQADAFVALLKSTLAESVFEETAVRDFYETYGPLDLPRVEQILSDLLEVHPDNHHIRFYLKTIRNGDPHT